MLNIVENGNMKQKNSSIWESESQSKDCKSEKDKDRSEGSNPITCGNIQHNTEFYNPEKLNKGKYLEVSFKNDLIFDLDM